MCNPEARKARSRRTYRCQTSLAVGIDGQISGKQRATCEARVCRIWAQRAPMKGANPAISSERRTVDTRVGRSLAPTWPRAAWSRGRPTPDKYCVQHLRPAPQVQENGAGSVLNRDEEAGACRRGRHGRTASRVGVPVMGSGCDGAGDGDRTRDIKLGKLAFYR